MLAAHPYEEPAYDVIELAALDEPDRGSGRIGRLAAPMTLRDFAAHVAAVLAETAHGVRVAGDPDQQVADGRAVRWSRRLPARPGPGRGRRRLPHLRPAAPPGLGAARARRHPALVDVAHWAAESTWLPVLRDRLVAALNDPGPGDTVEVRVSATNTDPWTFRA